MKKIKAGLIQLDIRLGKITENLSSALKGIEKLGAENCDLAVLPEMWSCGFDNAKLYEHAKKTPDIIQRLQQAACDRNIVIAGSLPEKFGRRIFNTMVIIDKDGHIAGRYRKVHLFSLTGEHKYFGTGKKAVICTTSIGRVAPLICYDLRFPELSRVMALKGAQIFLVSAQWPIGRINHWDFLLRARAIENQVFVVAVNRCGDDPEISYGGHSALISPGGEVLASAMGKETDCPSVFCGQIDLEEAQNMRNLIPCLKERVPQAYELF